MGKMVIIMLLLPCDHRGATLENVFCDLKMFSIQQNLVNFS